MSTVASLTSAGSHGAACRILPPGDHPTLPPSQDHPRTSLCDQLTSNHPYNTPLWFPGLLGFSMAFPIPQLPDPLASRDSFLPKLLGLLTGHQKLSRSSKGVEDVLRPKACQALRESPRDPSPLVPRAAVATSDGPFVCLPGGLVQVIVIEWRPMVCGLWAMV